MHVAILGLGQSVLQYLHLAKGLGGRRKVADEVWGINSLGGVLQCDRLFHMDDFRIQEIRASASDASIAARFEGLEWQERADRIKRAKGTRDAIAAMLDHLKAFPGPIYTPFPHPDYPTAVAYPLEEVVNATNFAYFNNTAAYAMAFASYSKVSKVSVFGCDYSYPDRHFAERGRGCLEFWLGYAAGGGGRARGMDIVLPNDTTLMDTSSPRDERFYGYDCVHVEMSVADGVAKLNFRERETLPTADEIEDRYDHTK